MLCLLEISEVFKIVSSVGRVSFKSNLKFTEVIVELDVWLASERYLIFNSGITLEVVLACYNLLLCNTLTQPFIHKVGNTFIKEN